MSEKPVRTFVAIELDNDIHLQLSRVQEKLRRHLEERWIRWVQPQGIHLTLNFLGNVPPSQLEEIKGSLSEACRPLTPFQLRLGSLGCFPSPNSPRVIWLGVQGELPALFALQAATTQTLARLGFHPESRPYSPHLTLGRIRQEVKAKDRALIGSLVQGTRAEFERIIPVKEVSLMRSDLTPQGARYSRLAAFPLEGDLML